MLGLEGKVVLVTGGGSGIGEAISLRFAQEKAHVAILDRNADGAQRVSELVRKYGVKAHAEVVDISDYAAVVKAVTAVEARLGPISVLVNNAGWEKMLRFLDTDEALRDELLRINLKGPINVTHAVTNLMVQRGDGKVVTISSDAGLIGSTGQAVYSACKAGVIALTKSLARELARYGVLLNAVCPGPIKTPLMDWTIETQGADARLILERMAKGIPLRRIGQPEDVSGIVAFLASEEANFITGQVLSVSGGLTMHG